MATARIFISGSVQGIGFRYFVKSNARRLKLTGWVKNTDDGRVEVLAQGSKENLEKLVKFCEKGPFLAEVKSVIVDWEEEMEKFQSFEILH
ncbi:MAG TPA: acylphosphatase [Patescibacteria group bacterium]|jgi:acylphosphatase|nr:acylphosphatase [Patescibacteria group bacterium]